MSFITSRITLPFEVQARLDDVCLPATPENVIDVCRRGLETIEACRAGESDFYRSSEWGPYSRSFKSSIAKAEGRA